jgi:hypothetical protein
MLALKNPRRPDTAEVEIEALADTGAVYLIIPEHMGDWAGTLGEAQAAVGKQLGGGRVGRGDHPQAQLPGGLATFAGQKHIHAFDTGNVLDELAGTGAQTLGLHPLFERAP